VLNLQKQVLSMKEKLEYYNRMAPELEANKKVAAAARNFKEAARLANDIKSNQNSQINTETAIKENDSHLTETKIILDNYIKELQQSQQKFNIYEREIDEKLIIALQKNQKNLKKKLLLLRSSIDKEVLQAEYEALQADISQLRIKQNFSDQFLNIEDITEEAPVEFKEFLSAESTNKDQSTSIVEPIETKIDVTDTKQDTVDIKETKLQHETTVADGDKELKEAEEKKSIEEEVIREEKNYWKKN